MDESAQPGQAAGVYDYSRGEYTGESYEERPLGERAPIGDELTRAMGSQTYKAGYLGSSKRSAGDATGASSSPYPSSGSYFAPTYITDPFLAGKRNIKLGPVNIGLGMSANAEYNDNITAAHEDGVDDIIAGIYMNVDANYKFSQNNTLSMAATLGVDHYFNHPELSPNGEDFNYVILPGTTLAFDIGVGDIHFVLYDRVSVRPSSNSQSSVTTEDQFGSFQNDIGLGANWAINSKLNLSLNFNRADTRETSDEVKTQAEFMTGERQAPANAYNRTINSISGSLAWTPTGTYTIGLEGSFSTVDYETSYNNDSTTLSGGVFVAVPITRSTLLKASGGWQVMEFDAAPTFTATDTTGIDSDIATLTQEQADIATNAALNGLTQQQVLDQQAAKQAEIDALNQQKVAIQTADDQTLRGSTRDATTSFEDYYYNVTLFNQLSARISHQFSFGHESSLNINSNFITADYATYGVGIVAWRGARFSISTYYEDSVDSGGRLAESVEQWGVDALLTHRLTDRLTAGVGYHYGNTDSETVGRDYEQTSYSFDLSYTLNQKMSLGLGYRFLTTEAEVEDQGYEQNRITLSMNYNF